MTSLLASAFTQGFTADQVIQYLARKSPQFAKQIASATGVGYTPKQILRYLTKDNPKEREAATEYEETRTRDQQKRSNINKAAIGGALTATTAPVALSAASHALSRAVPHALQTLVPQVGHATDNGMSNQNMKTGPLEPIVPQTPSNQTPVNVSQQPPLSNVNAASIPEPANIEQDKGKSNIVDRLWTGFEKGRDKGFDFESDAFLKVAKRMKSTGEIRSKEDFERFFNIFDTKKNEGKDLPTALKEASIEYDNQKLSPTEQLTQNEEPQLQKAKSLQEPIQEQEKPKIEKNSVVSSPNGIGEVKELRNGQAIIDVDGKLHKVKEEDLESEPKDVIQTVQELLKIPEVDRSSIVSLFTYDPDENKMYVQYHNGDTYKYLDVEPEKVFNIANKMGIPITQGKNIFGAWSPEDKNSLGATLIKEIINDPKYKKSKKGQPENPNYVKLETLYDYWEKLRKKPKRK